MRYSGKRGKYQPKGKCHKTTVVEYRSSYEHAFAEILDASSKVSRWEFENHWISYTYLGKKRKYLMDFTVYMSNGIKLLIEIKPHAFYLKAMREREKNMNFCKWEAAKIFAANNGYHFRVITEPALVILAKEWK